MTLERTPQPLHVLAGPCAVESLETTMTVAREVKRVCVKLGLPFHVKASYRKANRSRLDSFAGIGDEKALAILAEVKAQLDVGIVTDIHLPEEAAVAAHVADVLQIPAFLCRQTDLLVAAAATGKVVNIKKGQFMAPSSMVHAVRKVQESGNEQVWLTERGTMHGYGDLVVDMRGLTEMRAFAPVHGCHPQLATTQPGQWRDGWTT